MKKTTIKNIKKKGFIFDPRLGYIKLKPFKPSKKNTNNGKTNKKTTNKQKNK